MKGLLAMPEAQKLSRDFVIAGLTAIVALAGWMANDRLRAAAKEQKFDDDAQTIVELKSRLDSVPKDFVTRQEFEQVRQLIQSDHAETITSLNHLGDRIDHLALLDGQSRGGPLSVPTTRPTATMARAKE